MEHKGLLVVLAATSGTGKTTVSRELIERWPRASISVSFTTRAPRKGEVDGEHYHFISRERFQEMIANDEFLEFAEVHGNYYGTGLQATRDMLAQGRDILLDIDVQGAENVRQQFGEQCVLIFLLPPSWDAMLQRLTDRGTDDEAEINKRLQTARTEMPLAGSFDYLVVNGFLEEAVQSVLAILRATPHRTALMQPYLDELLRNMPA
ncbi:MAG: guanylate kinase [Deltaproteobacteria bacterium]|nr:MAG: guanylate kinase [Deltaproteobacteria bacterium]